MTEETKVEEQDKLSENGDRENIAEKEAATKVKNGNSQEVFDWKSLESGKINYTDNERTQFEKLYGETLASITQHDVVEGTIVSLTNKEVVVNIGFKSEGVIQLSEFRYNPDLKAGDKAEVYIEIQEDKTGQLVLSHKKARILKAWDRINSALESGEIIQGFVKCRTKGGLIVDVFGIEAFLPGSQIDVKPIRDFDIYVNKTMEFKVVKINKEYKNVVVSHKALIEAELEDQKKEIISKLEKGQVLEGIVKNITSYGVFIDLGGVDGLVHITDLSWGRIAHPNEVVELDQKINVVILDFDEAKTRIQLGLKQLQDHPWGLLDKKIAVGDKIKGKVVVVADYGAFMEVQPGIEGLIHVSEMSWSQHLRSAHDFLKVGSEVEAEILTLDRDERKMSLGIKQLITDPWKNVDAKYPINSKHKGIIRNFTNYGVFVELEEGVDGLIHISDLSWSKKIKHPSEFANLSDEIEIVILDINIDERKVSLGHKQLEENPWDVFETVFTIDSVHQGTILSMSDKGGIISLPYGVEGFSPLKHLIKTGGEKANIDEMLDFKVIEFSKENKRILISHTYTHSAPEEEIKEPPVAAPKASKPQSIKKAVKSVRKKIEKTTLGDIEALSTLKTDMDAKNSGEPKEKQPEKKTRKKKTDDK